jgi:hypothetical protein
MGVFLGVRLPKNLKSSPPNDGAFCRDSIGHHLNLKLCTKPSYYAPYHLSNTLWCQGVFLPQA